MEEGDLRTRVAMQAHDFAAAFRSVVGHMRIPPGAYTPDLTAPEGPSTRDGKQAMQRIRLVPAAEGFPTLVVGSANVKSGRAMLRSFDYVDALHREHFGRPVELDRPSYDEFIKVVRNYFAVAQLEVAVEEAPAETVASLRRQKQKASPLALTFVGVAALAAAGALAYYLTH